MGARRDRAAGRAADAAGRRPARRLAHHAGQDQLQPRAGRARRGRRRARSRRRGRSIEAREHDLTVTLPAERLRVERRPDPAGAGDLATCSTTPPSTRPSGGQHRASAVDARSGRASVGRIVVSDNGVGIAAEHARRTSSICSRRPTDAGTRAGRAGHRADAGRAAGRDARRHGRRRQRRAGPRQRVHRAAAAAGGRRASARRARATAARRRGAAVAPRRDPGRRRQPATPPRACRGLLGDCGHEVRGRPRRPGGARGGRARSGPRWCCSTSGCPT